MSLEPIKKLEEFLKRHVLELVLIDILAAVIVFGLQGFQIHTLNNQQAQLNGQQTQITRSDQKSNCWSDLLDQAVKRAPLPADARSKLLVEAQRCVKLP